MSEPRRPLLADLKDECGLLGADLQQWAALHWDLAQLEWQAAASELRRLAIAAAIAAVMALTALPLLLVAVADVLDTRLGISGNGWLVIFGSGLLVIGATGGYLAWRRFRRHYVGIQQTLEEVREDLAWMREWVEGSPGR